MKVAGRSITSFIGMLSLAALIGLSQTTAWSQRGDTSGSDLWRPVSERGIPERGRRLLRPEKYLVVRLDRAKLRGLLDDMPAEFSNESGRKHVAMDVPMPDGSISRYRIENSPVLAPHLAADFPSWKTFHGYGLDDPTATARFDWTQAGFHGYIFTEKGTVYIDPFQEGDTETYLVYFKHEFGPRSGSFSCGVDDLTSQFQVSDLLITPEAIAFSHGTNIRTYRIAIATTGEWARSNTMSTDPQAIRQAALAAMTTSVNRLDGIFRREIAVSLQLVNPSITSAANIIFDDPATDPYNNTDQEAQLNINQTTIDARVGSPNYDVGHLYGTGGGGVASSPSVCSSSQKAEGYSAREGIPGDPFTVDYVAHEVGHQFGGSHTYNNRDMGGACTTRSTMNAYEVASGSTIMSYVGICNIRNLQQFVETGTPAFHIRSLTQMVANIQDADNGGSCGTAAAGVNAIPTVNAGANFTIPRLTPFTLTATGNDADPGDAANLLYSWEQYDLAPSGSGQLGTPALTYDVDTDGILRPLFRAYSPVASPSRTFPTMSFILSPANNAPAGSNNPPLTYTGTSPSGLAGAACAPMSECVIGENLPSVARTMNFRVSVRDRRGGTADAGMTVTTINTAGPFQISVQNTPISWAAGSMQTITWDVVGTNSAPIGVANVNILMSSDGGQTFPTMLAANTPNDGTELVTIPNTPTMQARIRVEAVGNIFFDINNANFEIAAGGPTVNVGDAGAQERTIGLETAYGAGTIDFTVSLSQASAVPVTVRVSTDSMTATEGSDFVAVDNLEVVFPPNTLTRTVAIQTIEDPGDEPDETFSLDVMSVTGASVSDGRGIGTIFDDDGAPAGTEGDLAPRPSGDGVFRSNDLSALQLFFTGVAFTPGSNEFQRADVAPSETRGDGRLAASDVQLMRNYIAQLAIPQSAGGPTEPVAPTGLPEIIGASEKRALSVRGSAAKPGEDVTVAIEMNGCGDETIASFTIDFDPSVLSDAKVRLGNGVSGRTTLITNMTRVSEGEIGVLVDSDGGFAMSAGELLTITFDVARFAPFGSTPIALSSSLVAADISDPHARSLAARYESGSVVISEGKSLDLSSWLWSTPAMQRVGP